MGDKFTLVFLEDCRYNELPPAPLMLPPDPLTAEFPFAGAKEVDGLFVRSLPLSRLSR